VPVTKVEKSLYHQPIIANPNDLYSGLPMLGLQGRGGRGGGLS